jgi:hypothetical protein
VNQSQPFSPEQVVQEYSALLDRYRVHGVTGDRYGGEWPREQFRNSGFRYEVSDLNKTDLYRELIPTINSARIKLLDNPPLVAKNSVIIPILALAVSR